MTFAVLTRRLILACATAVIAASCSSAAKDSCGGFVAPLRVLTPTPATLALDIGAQSQVSANLSGGCSTDDPNVTWASSDALVATVSASGAVKAVAAGTANIIATAFDGVTRATIPITVRARVATTIDARPDVDTLSPLGTRALTVTVRDQNNAVLANAPIVWRSLTPNLASVTATGTVSAIASGTATIEAATPRTSAADSLRDTVRILIVPACNLVRPVQLGNTFSGAFDASTCQNLYGYRIANQYSVSALTQTYYSVRVAPTVPTTLIPLNIGSQLFGLPTTDTAATALVVIRPGTFGFVIAAPATTPGSYAVTTALDPDPKLSCVLTDVTTGVSFRTAVTPTCTTRDIRILPALTAGQQVRITGTAPTYAAILELRNFATGALIQRAVAPTVGGTATISVNNGTATPLVFLRLFGGLTVNDYLTITIAP